LKDVIVQWLLYFSDYPNPKDNAHVLTGDTVGLIAQRMTQLFPELKVG
jgi:hypothetical protein